MSPGNSLLFVRRWIHSSERRLKITRAPWFYRALGILETEEGEEWRIGGNWVRIRKESLGKWWLGSFVFWWNPLSGDCSVPIFCGGAAASSGSLRWLWSNYSQLCFRQNTCGWLCISTARLWWLSYLFPHPESLVLFFLFWLLSVHVSTYSWLERLF